MEKIWLQGALILLGIGACWIAFLVQGQARRSARRGKKRPKGPCPPPARASARPAGRVRRSKRRRGWFGRAVLLCCLLWALAQAGREVGNLLEQRGDSAQSQVQPDEAGEVSGSLTSAAREEGQKPDFESLEREAPVVYLEREGQVLYEQNADQPTAPASTTKLLTALTVLDWIAPETQITVGPEAEWPEPDASRAWLSPGDRLSLRQALIALLLPSGNDAAWTLAVAGGRAILGQETEEKRAADRFVEEMNRKAQQLGATHSHFVRPDGYDAGGQYTTARDLALLGQEALENETLAGILGMSQSTETWADGRQVTYQSSNLLLQPDSPWYDSRVIGLKTGSTDQAGCCLVSAARIGGRLCLCVVMGDSEEGRWRDTSALFGLLEED